MLIMSSREREGREDDEEAVASMLELALQHYGMAPSSSNAGVTDQSAEKTQERGKGRMAMMGSCSTVK